MERNQVLEALVSLSTSRDLDALNNILLELFGPDGPLKSFSVHFNAMRKAGFCILELMPPLLEPEIREVGALSFGEVLCIEFSMPEVIGDAPDAEDAN